MGQSVGTRIHCGIGTRGTGTPVDPTGHHDDMTDQTVVPPVPGVVDLHARLAAGETLFGAFAGLGSPVATEIMARSGFDWLIIDLEHGAGTETDLLANLHAMGATPAAALVRPQSGERLRIGRALDLGAHGIMVPRVDTPEQAREAISFMRYPPDGTRGLALSTRGAGLGELGHTQIQAINGRILGIIQIESRSAVDHADEIAAIDGVDVLFVGPTDLSHSLGIPGGFDDPVYLDAIRHVATTAEAAGKAAGILLRDASSLPRHRELGFRFIGLGSDGAFITDGARAVLAATGA
jgi:4-hydroxy-2-oxoheptanedioate aldolase